MAEALANAAKHSQARQTHVMARMFGRTLVVEVGDDGVGGADPAEVLTRLGDRAQLIHIKDGPAASYEEDVMVPIGDGAMDWAGILTAPAGLRWHIVELERLSIDTFDALERSYRYLVDAGLSRGGVE